MTFRIRNVLTGIALVLSCSAHAGAGTGADVPPYQLNRADEDYRYLLDPARRSDLWDQVKFVPLSSTGSTYLSLGGEARERYEYFSHPNWGKDQQDHGSVLQRYFLHADLQMGAHVRLFSQLQSSLEDGRAGGPRPADEDQLDLHQAFLDLTLPINEESSFTLRSGRQELAYGSQRIVAVREGPNVRQSFDGFRGMLRLGGVQLDGFATRPAKTVRHLFDDGPDNGRALWGVYSVTPVPVLSGGSLDLYYLGFYNRQGRFNQGAARETRHSVGARLWKRTKPFDYNLETVYQWGSFGKGEIRAWMADSDTGYTFSSLPLRPRLGVKANMASGDENPADKDLQTFNQLFPKGAYISEDNLVGPTNLINLNPSLTLSPADGLTVTVDWDFFWRESTHDGVYNNAGALVRSGKSSTSRTIGNQPQAQLEWNIDRHTTFVVVYAHFFAGRFLKETGPGKDVEYVTSWVTYKF
jgi:hypothetical protein